LVRSRARFELVMLVFWDWLGSDRITIIDAFILWILINFLKILVNAICLIVWAGFWVLVANATSVLVVLLTLVSKLRVRGLGCACLRLVVLAWLITILFSCAGPTPYLPCYSVFFCYWYLNLLLALCWCAV
jgi:hypothetical protein